jgi:hypothetical protein
MNVQFVVDIECVEDDADVGILQDAVLDAVSTKLIFLNVTVQKGECY